MSGRTIAQALLFVFLLAPAAAQFSAGALDQVDAMAAADLARDKVGGLTVGVVSGSSLVWTKSYGYADMEKKIPASRETVYRIGSVTKMFTALMLLQLAEQGKARFSDPVEKYYPEVNRVQGRWGGAPPITLLQLATMSSGLAREPEDLRTFLRGPVADWEKVLVAALARTKYEFEPGARYHYSNVGYAILGAALARAAGQPYTDYIRQRILAPLGMTSTGFEPGSRIRPRLAQGYQLAGATVDAEEPAREHRGRGYKVPNGALYSTVDDLARWAAFLLGEGPAGVLKKETLEASFERVYSAAGTLRSGYGIGMQVTRRGEMAAFGHGGSLSGYQAGVYVDRASRSGAIVLRNAGGGRVPASGLAVRILEKLREARRGTSQ